MKLKAGVLTTTCKVIFFDLSRVIRDEGIQTENVMAVLQQPFAQV